MMRDVRSSAVVLVSTDSSTLASFTFWHIISLVKDSWLSLNEITPKEARLTRRRGLMRKLPGVW
jgi:hypothetical protein